VMFVPPTPGLHRRRRDVHVSVFSLLIFLRRPAPSGLQVRRGQGGSIRCKGHWRQLLCIVPEFRQFHV